MPAAVRPDPYIRPPSARSCSACKGKGWVPRISDKTGGELRLKCKFCNGSGRMTCQR